MTEPKLHLTQAEALVLYEWLARSEDKEALFFEHDAERLVVRRIEAQLDKLLVEPFRPDYLKLLSDARHEVVDRDAGGGVVPNDDGDSDG